MDQVNIYSRIGDLLSDGGVAPTPANYEFWYRYATAADPDLIAAVDAARDADGRLAPKTMDRIRVEQFGPGIGEDVGKLVDKTQAHLARLAGYVEQTGGDTRIFTDALRVTHTTLAGDDTEMQRALLAEMINATAAMIEKTERLEAQLAMSGQEITALRTDLETARSESRTDALTGLPNRKALNAYLEAQGARALADRKPLTLVFCDIDHFKRFNDTWGHRLGDEVLRLVAKSLEQMCHGIGFPARYGGEEFVIVLPGRSLDSAIDIAEQFRDFVGSRALRAKQSNREIGRVTLSLGLAELRWTDSIDGLLERADAALYRAKETGRNRVCTEADLEQAA